MVKKLWMIIWMSEISHIVMEKSVLYLNLCVYLDDHFYANGSILIVPVFHPTRSLKVIIHSVSSDCEPLASCGASQSNWSASPQFP